MSANTNPESVLFIKIDNPHEVRKSLLESSRDTIMMLKMHEKFREIRIRKAQEIMRLRETMKDISKLVVRLKSSIPDIKINLPAPPRQEKPKEIKQAQPAAPARPKPVEQKSPVASLSDLDSQLKQIEEKLGRLS